MKRLGETRVITGILPAAHVEVMLTGAMLRRLRAHMERLESSEPGLGYEAGESDEDSLKSAVSALIDGGLEQAEREHGLVADFLTGDLRPYARPPKLRAKQAWRMVRHGH